MTGCRKNRNEKKLLWYWAAAACLLLALLTPWFLSTNKENVMVTNNMVEQKIKLQPARLVPYK